MPRYSEEQVRRVREAIDLAQLMNEYTPVRRAGHDFVCCCPFHQERTPSLHIYVADQHYYCFGCKAHGDVFSLVMAKENLGFADAVEWLARRAGIVLEPLAGGAREEREARSSLLAAVEFACGFYERCLWESSEAAAARRYLLEQRRLSIETCRRFRVGWAPGRNQLLAAARAAGHDPRVLQRVDLVVERQGTLGDRFFARITFPICDRFGHPLAFSARLLPEAEAAAKAEGRGVGKYINNTDTPLYRKSTHVFNLHHARLHCREEGRLIVMEGPTDVMAADQAGIHACVAVLGTALSGEHARQLATLIGDRGDLVLLFDGDRAGQENALKAVRTCLAAGVASKVVILPDDSDPAELLAEGGEAGKQAFLAALQGARRDFDHLLQAVAPAPARLDRRGQLAAADAVLAAIDSEPDRELAALHLADAAAWLGLPESLLRQRQAGAQPRAPSAASERAREPAALPLHLAQALHILVHERALRGQADALGLEPRHWPAPWDALAAALLLADPPDVHAIVADPAVAAQPPLAEAAHRWAALPLADAVPAIGDPAARLAEIARTVLREETQQRLRALDQEIAEAERTGARERLRQLLAERHACARQLHAG
ncbi:MAG: DNA primase [Planctomycetes bacterium]|nr:DNA primase [Planctomycetota bacterium]